MVKEVLIGAAGAIVIAAIIAAMIRYIKAKEKSGKPIERIYIDELNTGEIKAWFKDKFSNDNQKGVVFYPTKENTEKWKVKMPDNQNLLIQIVYDMDEDNVVSYREIAFSELSEKLRELLDANGGTLVIEK